MKLLYYESVIGRLRLGAEKDGLVSCDLCSEEDSDPSVPCYVQKEEPGNGKVQPAECASLPAEEGILNQACLELDEYFAGRRHQFQVPLLLKGTEFQKKVWEALREIPFGQTSSYGAIAEKIGCPKGARAVGMGCNKNPVMLFVPCHRVVGKKGALTGFACGLQVKAELLALEALAVREDTVMKPEE